MNTAALSLLLLGCSVYISSCAFLLRPYKPNTMEVHSEPDSASIFIDGEYKGITPTTLELSCQKRYVIELYKQGYHVVSDTVIASIPTGWGLADVLASIPLAGVPIVVDRFVGDNYALTAEQQVYTVPLIADTITPSIIASKERNCTLIEPRMAVWTALGGSFSTHFRYRVLPSYVVGFSYTATPVVTARVGIEPSTLFSYQGVHPTIAALYTTPEDRAKGDLFDAVPTVQVRSIGLLADATVALFGSGLYATCGAGILYVDVHENHIADDDKTAVHWLPVLSAGMGYYFRDNGWFIELQHRRAVVPVVASYGSFIPMSTSFRIGMLLPL